MRIGSASAIRINLVRPDVIGLFSNNVVSFFILTQMCADL
jgi:hypothetical protein